MLHKVKLEVKELFLVKKGLDFTLYGLKNWQNFEMKICLLRREGEGGNISMQVLLKN